MYLNNLREGDIDVLIIVYNYDLYEYGRLIVVS